ncbi:dual OB domain-containing protein [Leptolinea tardivitalis]|uniref:Dual OB-containing domain-containing protein n=1 Tax=Leptolinea tardivitalis TaxID=229920 RepID=A0A0N8GLU4_9CHLR|nr:hypothetical protein [Leptolinea tardivitalis]KPL73466.1 hypothetical protein ADM99_04555 [Leptolinea tardivitalis]GAP21631.1 hypothetical protein LTAR_01843 [Leptolinea tardivitalis]
MTLTHILITDVTRMQHGHVCVAGIQKGGGNIRPVLPHCGIPEDWLYQDEKAIIRPFACVELDLQKAFPNNPHTEDWVIDPETRIFHELLPEDIRESQLTRYIDSSVADIFGADIYDDFGWYIKEGEGNRSLGTIIPKRIENVVYRQNDFGDGMDYRIHFKDAAGHHYRLKVTDLSFRYFFDHRHTKGNISCEVLSFNMTEYFQSADVILRIGLTRPTWEKHPHCCALQITGVYTFPDYLEGRCFADFRPES